nr:MAG TPA: hypothetical protein [Caudoviricetes sp.]
MNNLLVINNNLVDNRLLYIRVVYFSLYWYFKNILIIIHYKRRF